MNEIVMFALIYGGIIILTIFIVSMMFRGFFWKYLKVRTGFGKYVLIKVRSELRDYYLVGTVEDNILKFKIKRDGKKISSPLPITNKEVFYRCMNVICVDIEEKTMALSKTDYTGITTNDVEVVDNLIVRALQKPDIVNNLQKLIIVLIIVGIVVGIVACYFGWKSNANDQVIVNAINTYINSKSQIVNAVI
jgi:hypothetical protein